MATLPIRPTCPRLAVVVFLTALAPSAVGAQELPLGDGHVSDHPAAGNAYVPPAWSPGRPKPRSDPTAPSRRQSGSRQQTADEGLSAFQHVADKGPWQWPQLTTRTPCLRNADSVSSVVSMRVVWMVSTRTPRPVESPEASVSGTITESANGNVTDIGGGSSGMTTSRPASRWRIRSLRHAMRPGWCVGFEVSG